jgi:hypothetical protein
MLNPFFLNGSKSEQGLIQDLVNEQLRMYGVDIYYLPRLFIKEQTITREVLESQFENAYPLEAYVSDFEGYGGQGTILSKFGLQDMDDLSLVISKERFETYITPLIKKIPNIKVSDRPKEGDLIWFPLGDRLFEIKFVEHEKPFYPLKGNYTYELRCELYRPQTGEVLDTGYEYVDDNLIDESYIQTLQMIGVGVTAQAITSFCAFGGIRLIEVTNMGHGYVTDPDVNISQAPSGGITAIATAILQKNLPDFCEPNKDLSKVVAVNLIHPGCGYRATSSTNFLGTKDTGPLVSIAGGGGNGSTGIASLSNGVVGIITITTPGSGYVLRPSITFVGGNPVVSAAATVRLTPIGGIAAIYITDAGKGYTSAPTIVISNPVNAGIGTYKFNEPVAGSVSGTTGRVKRWNVKSYILEVGSLNGNFIDGDVIIGQESGASYPVRIINTDNLADPDSFTELSTPENAADKQGTNRDIDIEASNILDQSEDNLFGIP